MSRCRFADWLESAGVLVEPIAMLIHFALGSSSCKEVGG
jgi:hypothetical protein